MDSSDTRDLDYKTRDWKYTQPLHHYYVARLHRDVHYPHL